MAEEGIHQIAHQTPVLGIVRIGRGRRFIGRGIPAIAHAAPAAAPTAAAERLEEVVIAHLPAQPMRALDQLGAAVETRRRRIRMLLADMGRIAAQDRLLHAARADHVERHHQVAATLPPGVGFTHHAGQLGNGARLGIAFQDHVQHRHEMALAAAEAAVQVGALGRVAVHRATDQRQRLLERLHQLRRHHVLLQRLPALVGLQAFSQAQDEVALVDGLRDGEDVTDRGHSSMSPSASRHICRIRSGSS